MVTGARSRSAFPKGRDEPAVANPGDEAQVAVLDSGDTWLLLGDRFVEFVPSGKMKTGDFPSARVVE